MDSVLPQPQAPALTETSPTSLGWIAGPIVGGIAFFVLIGAGYWWLHQRRAASNKQDQYSAAAPAVDLDGATPREGGSVSGIPRAQATLN
jgi:hypothetical protein